MEIIAWVKLPQLAGGGKPAKTLMIYAAAIEPAHQWPVLTRVVRADPRG